MRAVARRLGRTCEIAHLENPRTEREEHYYNCVNTNLRSLGLEPTALSDETIAASIELASAHRNRIDERLIPPRVQWRPEPDPEASRAVAS